MTSKTNSDFSHSKIIKKMCKKIKSIKFCDFFKTHKIDKVIKYLKKYTLSQINKIYSDNKKYIKSLQKKLDKLIHKILCNASFKNFMKDAIRYEKNFFKYLTSMFTKCMKHSHKKYTLSPKNMEQLQNLTLSILIKLL